MQLFLNPPFLGGKKRNVRFLDSSKFIAVFHTSSHKHRLTHKHLCPHVLYVTLTCDLFPCSVGTQTHTSTVSRTDNCERVNCSLKTILESFSQTEASLFKFINCLYLLTPVGT